MKVSPGDLQQRMNSLKEGLREAGVKLTHQRLEIFREVALSDNHPDAETVYRGVRKRMPTVSLDTVYRTLWLLVDLGLIKTLGPPRERTRFEADLDSHHHFVCVKCGMTRDFQSNEFDCLVIPEEVKKIGIVEKAHVEVQGICKQCSRRKN